MKVRCSLSSEAYARLETFCELNLKPALDPVRYAAGLHSASFDYDLFEIRGFDTATGNPATITFSNAADFDYDEVGE